MMDKDPEKLFLEKVRNLLNQGTKKIEGQTERRLEEIRSQALLAADKRRSRFLPPRRWVLAGSFAMATLAAAALFFLLSPSTQAPLPSHLEDLEIVTSRDRLDLYQNLDFYRWLGSREIRKRPNGKGL